ncbi:hypothetical protein OGZ51_12225 [Lactococcus lactis]|uniref:Uncharacterized protein n=1 Tax=Lactococcus lactis TaxID=1358 RepID=A0A9X4NIV0_9LACT|nr:hypothetical protein [Lactococcus lactis]MDG4984911.1 hypothetical protein [Lactococcus lactis]
MNINFKFKKFVYQSGEVSDQPIIIFEDKDLNDSWLDAVLTDGDNDYTANEYLNIFNNYKFLSKQERNFNGENWDWEIADNGVITISDIYEQEDDWSEEDLRPSITISVIDLKTLFSEYRRQAKEFRTKLPEMQKQEDERRLLDENTFGF